MPLKYASVPYSRPLITKNNMANVRISESEVTLTSGFYNDV